MVPKAFDTTIIMSSNSIDSLLGNSGNILKQTSNWFTANTLQFNKPKTRKLIFSNDLNSDQVCLPNFFVAPKMTVSLG